MVVKLLVITPIYYPEVGGGALATYLMINLLAKLEGLKITVLTGCKAPKRTKGVNYIYDPFLKTIDKNLYPPQVLFERYERIIRAHDIVYISYAFPLIPIAERLRKETIVHLHDYRPISPSGTLLVRSRKSSLDPIKSSFIISIAERKGLRSLAKNVFNVPYTTMLIRRWVCMADKILVVSRRHATLVSEYMPECKNKIKIQYNPLPHITNLRKNLDQIPSFLFVGGDSYIKGFHILIKAIKYIAKNYQKTRFILAGSLKKESIRLINLLNRAYGEKIYIIGKITHEQVVDLHKTSWALLFPSIVEEPLPYAVLESLVFGTVPIASMVGGVVEIVEGTRAENFLITPGRVEELSKKIETIMSYDKNTFEEQFTRILPHEFREKYTKNFLKQFQDNFLSIIR